MIRTVTISARRLKRLERAEAVAQCIRSFYGQRVIDQTQAQTDFTMKCLIRWADMAGKARYQEPKGWPK